MCQLAFAGLARVAVDDREMRRAGPCYAIDTVREFRAEVGEDTPLCWLIGADNLPLLPLWHDHHALLADVTVVTYPRAGFATDESVLENLDFTAQERHDLIAHCLEVAADRVSATDIRAGLARGETPDTLPGGVADYIAEHDLYG